MLNLLNFFKNHFDTSEISDDNLRKFAEDHLARMNSNSTVANIAANIAATQATYNAYNTAIINETTSFAQQQTKTIKMTDAYNAFLVAIRQKEGLIRSNWDLGSAEYESFFPLGLTEYNNATLANIETLMTRFVNIAQSYQTTLGAPFVAQFTALKNNFVSARTMQLGNISSVENMKTITANTRNALEMQMMRNLLFVASIYLGQADKLSDFFDQSIIRRANTPDDGSIKTEVPAQTTVNIETKQFSPSANIIIEVVGEESLSINLGATLTDSGGGIMVKAGEKRSFAPLELGAAGNTFLNATNLSTNTHSSLRAEIF